VVPSESDTVPVPDQVPLKPANGLDDCALPAGMDNTSAAPKAAAFIVCPNEPEANPVMAKFPFN
jgi:hypothetical protein